MTVYFEKYFLIILHISRYVNQTTNHMNLHEFVKKKEARDDLYIAILHFLTKDEKMSQVSDS